MSECKCKWVRTEMEKIVECANCGFMLPLEDVPAWLRSLPHFADVCPVCGAAMGTEMSNRKD